MQGTTEVFTAWFPLIDCAMETGPLQVAEGTHTGEVYDFDIGTGAGGIEITDPFEGRWVSGPFTVGDVLIFHSLLVHKGVRPRRPAANVDGCAVSTGVRAIQFG